MPAKPATAASNSSRAAHSPEHTVLLAVTGMSPAVLTETIWHLAMKEEEPCIPDVVKVLTTIQGREAIQKQLMDSKLWQTMRSQIIAKHPWAGDKLKFSAHPEHVRVFVKHVDGQPAEMGDVINLDDTEAVGDVMVDELWKHVEKPHTHLIASISGGFKTMGALLFSCMTLLASKSHRIVHVRVNEPFDGFTKPLFYWPEQPEQKLIGKADGKTYLAKKAKINLGDMAFVSLRDVFTHVGRERPRSYSALIEDARMDAEARADKHSPHLTLSDSSPTVFINDTRLEFSLKAARQYFVLYFLAKRAKKGEKALPKYHLALQEINLEANKLFQKKSARWHEGIEPLEAWNKAAEGYDATPLRKLLDEVKRKLKALGVDGSALLKCMPEAQHFGLDLPPEHITFVE